MTARRAPKTAASKSAKELYKWAEHLRVQGYSPTTVKTKAGHVAAVANAVGRLPWRLQADDVIRYLSERSPRANTRIVYLTALRQYAEWAGIPDPTKSIRRPRQPQRLPDPISEPQLARLLGATTGDRHLFVLLGACLGLRSHEVAQIHTGDILEDSDGDLVLRVTGKYDKFDMLPVPEPVAQLLRPRMHVDGYLFPARSGQGHIVPQTVSIGIKRVSRDLGIRMRFHQLRHRFGTQVYRTSDGDLLLTMQAMRHDNPSSTAGYAKVASHRRTEVMRSLPLPVADQKEEST